MGYSTQETVKKQKNLVSKSHRNKRKISISIFKYFLVALVTIIIGCAGAGFGMLKGILDNVPDIDKISIQPKGFKTIIYDENNKELESISTTNSNRIYVYYDDMPKLMVDAFVSIEDERFWDHNGIDVKGIIRAAYNGVSSGQFDEGASTITQQLIKNQVFNVGLDENTFMDQIERKIQEQYLAIELEKRYTKEEVVEYYLNTIYLGRGVHGIQAAANLYFNKDIKDLTISEMAVIAGITQNPSSFDPVAYPENNAKRRLMVLKKMKENGYINQAEYDEALNDQVYDRIADIQLIEKENNSSYNSYYTDAIIEQLAKDFMEIYNCSEEEAYTQVYTGGYSVYSVQDLEVQKICDDVINDTSYYGDVETVSLYYLLSIKTEDGEEINYGSNSFLRYYKELTGNDKYNTIYPDADKARAAADQFREAMVNETNGTVLSELVEIKPQPQFAFTLIDQQTGYIKAIVGGRGEKTSNLDLNRATHSKRQPGSAFKVIFAYLPLIDQNLGSLAKPYLDEAYTYSNGTPVYNWWGSKYRGYVSVRDGIKDSMNVIAAKAVADVTPEVAYDYALKLGFTTLVDQRVIDGMVFSDIQEATALGGLTDGVTNLEMTGAYATIANGGEYIKPVYYSKVIDHDGNTVIDNTNPEKTRVIKETTAWQLIDGMKSVVTSGTGTPARMQSGIKCAGKTGTTSNNYDYYFCGMTPYYTASIWMGFDSNTNMGSFSGSTHKIMWRDIMDQIAELEGQDPSLDWERPDGITTISLCEISGHLPVEDCPTITDYCATDSIPGIRCKSHEFIELCNDSHEIATDKCPNKTKYAVVEDPKTKKKTIVGYEGEYDEKIFDTKCQLHPEEEDKKEFTITSAAGNGGSISTTTKALQGSTVTFYITPFNGYKIKDVLVDGQSVGDVSSYTFVDLNENHSITVSFAKDSSQTTTEKPTTEKPTTVEPPTPDPPTTPDPPPTPDPPTTDPPTTPDPPTTDPTTPDPPTTDPTTPDPSTPD